MDQRDKLDSSGRRPRAASDFAAFATLRSRDRASVAALQTHRPDDFSIIGSPPPFDAASFNTSVTAMLALLDGPQAA